jgi:hypothetical protein
MEMIMKLILLLSTLLFTQLTYSKVEIITSSHIYESYSNGVIPYGKVFIIKEEQKDVFSLVVSTGQEFETIKLNIDSKYVNTDSGTGFIQYELDDFENYKRFSLQDVTVVKDDGEWSISGFRMFDHEKSYALFIVHHGRGHRSAPPNSDCMRFCRTINQ